jgi:hypothetical protein
MVKANRTNAMRSASVSPPKASAQDESPVKLSTRREESPLKPNGGRCGAPLVRETVAPRGRTGNGKASVVEYIGRELREIYDDVLAQPVPDRFLTLLNKLDAGAISSAQGDGRGEMD